MSEPQNNSGKRVGNSDKRMLSLKALVIGYGSIGQRHARILIELGYRVPRREIIMNTNRHTCSVDLIKNKIMFDGAEEPVTVARYGTYRAEHTAMLEGNIEELCTVEEAMETLATIQAAEQAALSCTWIER